MKNNSIPQYVLKEGDVAHKEHVDQNSISSIDETMNLPDNMTQIEKKLVRKLDYIYVMPFICLLMLIQYFDKSALNYSSVLGIKEDTHVSDKEFSWLGSIFHIGYLLYQVPNAYLMQKLPLNKYLGTSIVLWGAILGLTSLSKNFAQLFIFRFLLGVLEACVLPCMIITINRAYRKKEQTMRFCVMYIAVGLSMCFGGLLSYGIGHLEGVAGLKAWQWIMIILSSMTVVFGAVCYFIMMDDASDICRSEPEHEIVRLRSRDNAVVVSKKINFQHIREALTEIRYYCFMLTALLLHLQHGALSVFSATITKGFGFSNLNAILLTAPMGLSTIVFVCIAAVVQRKFKNSSLYTGITFTFISTIGLMLLLVIKFKPAKLIGLYLCTGYIPVAMIVINSMSLNVSGYTKKIFYSGSFTFFMTAGNFIGPQLIIPKQAPLFMGAMLTCITTNCVSMAALFIARGSMAKLNRVREENNPDMKYDKTFRAEGVEITDMGNDNFTYSL